MTLRTRLTVALLAVVLGPAMIGAGLAGGMATEAGRDRAGQRLERAAVAAGTAVAALCARLRTVAEAVAGYPAEDQPTAAAEFVTRGLADGIRVVDPAGVTVLATVGAPSQPWADCDTPAGAEADPTAGRYRAIAAGAGRSTRRGAARVWAAMVLDQAAIQWLATATQADVTLVSSDGDPSDPTAVPAHSTDRTAAATVAAGWALPVGELGESADGTWVWRIARTEGQPLPLVLSLPRTDPSGAHTLLAAVVVLAGLFAAVAAWWLVRSTTRSLGELTHAAERLAAGDLAVRVPVRAGDETGRLAAAFNRVTLRAQTYAQALTASRDQLRGHLALLGEALSSTHDLDRIQRVILRTALTGIGAQAGAVVFFDPASNELVGHRAERGATGAPAAPIRVPLGAGLVGTVAATGRPRRGRIDPRGLQPHLAEPACRTYLAVPLRGPAEGALPTPGAGAAVPGVLALYDRLGMADFDDEDLAALGTFAAQAAVAVENVRTHEEAQRLSLTDPLTGLWNYRYLAESLRREVERASRFRRMLTVLALDLDRFKEVNDVHGHPAGDAVLVELARRLRAATRDMDQTFRQGGEEFVVLLPETGVRGGIIVAERLGAAVRDTPVLIASRGSGARLRIQVTVSIGIAVFPDHARTPQAVLDAADDALYAAKAAGRDTYRVATAVPAPVAASELPVRSGARTPPHDLPQAGNEVEVSGGAQPPRQNRGR